MHILNRIIDYTKVLIISLHTLKFIVNKEKAMTLPLTIKLELGISYSLTFHCLLNYKPFWFNGFTNYYHSLIIHTQFLKSKPSFPEDISPSTLSYYMQRSTTFSRRDDFVWFYDIPEQTFR